MRRIHVTALPISGESIPKDVDPSRVHIIFGGDPSNPTWDEYLDKFSEPLRPHMKAVKEAIRMNGFMRMSGEEADNEDIAFVTTVEETDETRYWTFSWRGWGDLLQAIEGKRRGYMAFYSHNPLGGDE